MRALFVLMTLTQAAKLFACRGIVGTQICAAFYLYSYAISEALVWVAGDDWKSVPSPHLESGPLRDLFDAMSSIFFIVFAGTRFTTYARRTIEFAVLLTYLPLTFLNELLGAVPGRFSPGLGGASFVVMNSALSLLWFWKVWAQVQPACTVKPGWTDVFG